MRVRSILVLVAFGAWSFPAPASELSADQTKSAQRLYQVKCAKCHKFYNPTDYTGPDWQSWMQKMAKKSKLKPAQAQLLSRYLDTLRAPERK